MSDRRFVVEQNDGERRKIRRVDDDFRATQPCHRQEPRAGRYDQTPPNHPNYSQYHHTNRSNYGQESQSIRSELAKISGQCTQNTQILRKVLENQQKILDFVATSSQQLGQTFIQQNSQLKLQITTINGKLNENVEAVKELSQILDNAQKKSQENHHELVKNLKKLEKAENDQVMIVPKDLQTVEELHKLNEDLGRDPALMKKMVSLRIRKMVIFLINYIFLQIDHYVQQASKKGSSKEEFALVRSVMKLLLSEDLARKLCWGSASPHKYKYKDQFQNVDEFIIRLLDKGRVTYNWKAFSKDEVENSVKNFLRPQKNSITTTTTPNSKNNLGESSGNKIKIAGPIQLNIEITQ
jgi:hypothetical protein